MQTWYMIEVTFQKHHYGQSWWMWWNSSWAISDPKRWCCESTALNMPANWENSAVATGLAKVSFIPILKKGNAKECSNCRTIVFISHTSKAMLKILQARLQQDMNHELPDIQVKFRNDRETRHQIANIHSVQFTHSVVSNSSDPRDCSLPGSSVHGIFQALCHF